MAATQREVLGHGTRKDESKSGHPKGWPLHGEKFWGMARERTKSKRSYNCDSFGKMRAQERSLRLAATEYIGKRIYFVTVCTEGRAQHFVDTTLGRWIVEKLVSKAARQQFLVHAYCVMPDHLHFVVEGTEEYSNLIRFVERFKQETAYEFSKTRAMRLWQHRYYDHILRRANELEDVACYVWWNPVRQGYAVSPASTRYQGRRRLIG